MGWTSCRPAALSGGGFSLPASCTTAPAVLPAGEGSEQCGAHPALGGTGLELSVFFPQDTQGAGMHGGWPSSRTRDTGPSPRAGIGSNVDDCLTKCTVPLSVTWSQQLFVQEQKTDGQAWRRGYCCRGGCHQRSNATALEKKRAGTVDIPKLTSHPTVKTYHHSTLMAKWKTASHSEGRGRQTQT